MQEGTLAGLKTTKPQSFACSLSPSRVSLSKDIPFYLCAFVSSGFR